MTDYQRALCEFLQPMVNERRMELIGRVLSNRTRYITVLLEDIYQSQNASAVLRSCDCFGIQDVHIIENRNKYILNPEVELGAAQWLTIQKYNKENDNTETAIKQLKDRGYRIVATTPHTEDVLLNDFDLNAGKSVIMLGTERRGLTENALKLADEYLNIPMLGFTESFNISVSAGIILHQLTTKLRNSSIDWRLQESENEVIRLKWIKNSIRKIHDIENGFKKNYYS